jgi:FKBP-type peptidyl-prolyl cis-trans isomerase FklB
MSLFDKLQEAKNKKMNETLEAGRKFLEENAKRPEVVSLPSGLQYEVLTMGDGPKPTANQTVKCHYHGTLIDGRVFDSSVQRKQPASFPLNQVIMGWTQALQLMPVGSKWRLYLPPHLAYGDRQTGPLIAPHSTLIFEVELLAI